MRHALINPDGQIETIAIVDPTVQTKPGWRWVPYTELDMPTMSDPLVSLIETVTVTADTVVKSWSTVTRLPIASDVTAERDRRVMVFSFGGKQYQLDRESQINISGAGVLALAAIINGAQPGNMRWADAGRDFTWLATDNTSVTMDAQTCFAFAQAAAKWKADHIHAARTIKDMSPIPADYAANARWPS